MNANYLIALALTLAIEIPLALWVLRNADKRRVLGAALAGNLLTHATIHFALFRLGLSPALFEIVAESSAFAVEAVVYGFACRLQSPWQAVLASALANGASYAAGLLVLSR